ncbi:ankyrin repeat domain-containing protein [Chitinophaga horti]|uniref:Ankyrin repeat domain-containing protein n=1 Tax=Chitinophaga horti TaxID=2920382 RepID=A0ABY6J8S9_9BACT|nr:ankyrin repeat domain-containing protein [Chitinophaga horti]UYQ95731.1 ankyrin repeat domain-containing protein [Chitinophaga horti]
MDALLNALKTRNLEEAATLVAQGEKMPRGLQRHETDQIFRSLLPAKAYRLIIDLLGAGLIETDIYEYDRLDNSVFETLFRNVTNEEDSLQFLRDFVSKLDNVGDAVQDKTLLDIALSLQVPLGAVRILADAGCNVRRRNNADANYLYKVVQEYGIKEERGLEYLAYLLEQGLDANDGNVVGETPLHLAISKNKKQYITFLLENGADLNQQDKKGESPFYCALVHQVCDADTYKLLAAHTPLDFEQTNKDGETALLGAMRMRRGGSLRDAELLKALIDDGADVYQTSPYYHVPKSALDWMCEQPSLMLETALEAGVVDVDRRDDAGNTLLHKVCAYNVNYDQEVARQLYQKVKLLLAHGADPNATNDKDETPMMLAATDNLKSKTVELLLKQKV